MVMAGIIDDFKSSINPHGLITPRGGVTQNDILFSAYYLCCLMRELGHIPTDELARLTLCIDKYIRLTPPKIGLTCRFPGSNEIESNDNLIGWAYTAIIVDKKYAEAILRYARKTGWQWEGEASWEGKYPDSLARWNGRHKNTEAFLTLAAGETPDLFLQIAWALLALIHCFFVSKMNQDAFSLNFLMCDGVKRVDAPPIMRIAAGLWFVVWGFRGHTMNHNLINYGWGDTPYVLWFK